MRTLDIAHLTLENFRNRKSRAFLTVLGVSVAITAVFSLVAFGYGLQRNLLERITTEESLLTLDILPADADVIRLNPDTVQKIKTIPHVTGVSPQATFSGELVLGTVTTGTLINLVEKNFFNLEGVKPLSGSFFNGNGNSNGNGKKNKEVKAEGLPSERSVVVTSTIATLFNVTPQELVGKKVKIVFFVQKDVESSEIEVMKLPDEFEVIGVVESQAAGGEIFITSSAELIPVTEYRFAKVVVDENGSLSTVREELIKQGFLVSALSDVVEQANRIFHIVQIALAIFGIIALVVAAIGLINTMTIALLERTNEIGVMRAIGASPRDIKVIFLGESTLIGFLGGASGIIMGVASSEILNWTFNFLAVSLGGSANRLFAYPLWFSIFIIVLSTLVGLIGGLWPAIRASRMNPLQALKYK